MPTILCIVKHRWFQLTFVKSQCDPAPLRLPITCSITWLQLKALPHDTCLPLTHVTNIPYALIKHCAKKRKRYNVKSEFSWNFPEFLLGYKSGSRFPIYVITKSARSKWVSCVRRLLWNYLTLRRNSKKNWSKCPVEDVLQALHLPGADLPQTEGPPRPKAGAITAVHLQQGKINFTSSINFFLNSPLLIYLFINFLICLF